jgi:hypothetical protein
MRGPGLAIVKNPSGNTKLGDAATTHAAQASCPAECVFYNGGGCYAESGRQGMFVTRRLNEAAALLNASALDVAMVEADEIDAMVVVPGRPMRLHTVGDCPTDECARIVSAACERYMERGGGAVWTYTHGWRTVDRSSWRGVSVLASCETGHDIRAASARGYATALVVETFESDCRYQAGTDAVPIIPCPAQTRHGNCADCGLCFNDKRLRNEGLSIGFEVHGIPFAQRAAKQALSNPNDPERRISSEERIRIIRDRYLNVEGREPTIREVAEMIDLNPASVGEWLRYLRGEIVHPAERRRKARARA